MFTWVCSVRLEAPPPDCALQEGQGSVHQGGDELQERDR